MQNIMLDSRKYIDEYNVTVLKEVLTEQRKQKIVTDRNKALEEFCVHKEEVAVYSAEMGKSERFCGRGNT